MKIKNIMCAFILISIILSVTYVAQAVNKMAPRVVEVRGSAKRKHTIVRTTIIRDPKKEDSQTIFRRSVKGSFGGEDTNAAIVNVTLKSPEKEIEFKSDIPDMVAKMAGAIPDPNVGMAVSAAAALVDAGLEIAGNELTKKYGIDPCTIEMIEILPNQYYRIDTGTGKVLTTDAFNEDLEKYTELMKKYIPAAQAYNTALAPYNKAYDKWDAEDPYHLNDKKNDEITKMYEDTVKPALKARLEIESKLQTFYLQRYAIMAFNTTPETSCESVGCKGPWQLYVYFFIGAKQINVYEIDYCVPNVDQIQDFHVELIPNYLDENTGILRSGGLRLVSTRDNSIYFPKQESAERLNMKSRESRKMSWSEEMLVDENADVPGIYAFPFDVYKLKYEYEKMAQEKKDARSKERLEKLDKAVEEFKTKYPEYAEKKAAKEEKGTEETDQVEESQTEEVQTKQETTGSSKDRFLPKSLSSTKDKTVTEQTDKAKQAEQKKLAAAEKAKKEAEEKAAKKAGAETTAAREKARKEAAEKAKTEKDESLGLDTLFQEPD